MTGSDDVAGAKTDGPLMGFEGANAVAWHKWFHIMEDAAQPVSDLMVERAGLAPGHRVLDVATGLGEPAITAARRIAPTGFVEATDISEDMLGFGRDRAAALGVTNIAFRHMDAGEAGQSDAAYDAVLCRWGLMFVDGLDAVLAGLHQCLVPGGCLVATVWGPPEGAPALSLAARVVLESLGMPPPDFGAKTPFALADVAALERRFEGAGFAHTHGEWVTVTFTFESPEQFVAFRKDRSRPLLARIANQPAARQEAAWRAVAEAAARFTSPDGKIRMPSRAYCVSARR